MAYVPEVAMRTLVSLHRAIPTATNNDQSHVSGGQLVLALALA
jgi:hypothetical protein